MAHTKEFYISHLGLIPHPEGGWFREVYRSGSVPMASKGETDRTPFPGKRMTRTERLSTPGDDGSRNELTSIYWLAAGTPLHLCKNESDHVHYFLAGNPFSYHLVDPSKGLVTTAVLGSQLERRQTFQLAVPGNYWKCGKVLTGDEHGPHDFTLIAEAVAPGFDFHDFHFITRDQLDDVPLLAPQERSMVWAYLRPQKNRVVGFEGNGFHAGVYDEESSARETFVRVS